MDFEVSSLEYDSRRVTRNSLFFAIQGAVTDGHRYIHQVLDKGAGAIVSEQPAPEAFPVPWIQASEVRPYMALLANEYYGEPSRDLRLVGITGTNGKTTTAYLLHAILKQDAPSLMMGTINTVLDQEIRESERTTPEAIDIQDFLARGRDAGCRHGVLEVSSHALDFYRVYQCWFRVALFTNFSQDHLDFHHSMREYFEAKSLLFQLDYNPGLEQVVLNGDDPQVRLLKTSPDTPVTTFGFSPQSDVYPLSQQLSMQGIEASLQLDGQELHLKSALVGRHNLYNLMGAAVSARRLGIELPEIIRGIETLQSVPGRFERVPLEAPFSIFVDYAHTPEALSNVLRLARQVTEGRVLCLFGAGGDRDRSKRPRMGEIALELADQIVVTSDNPRSENPRSIIADIERGMQPKSRQWISIVDRREAIAHVLSLAKPGDLVLLAGKGHETYQEIDGTKLNFDDRQVAREVL